MKTIIWDFNGTILDDADVCLKAENEMLRRRNMNRVVSKEEYLELFEFPVINYYKKIGFSFEDETFEDVSVEFIELYNKYSNEYKLMDNFLDKIKESIKLGNRNVILSASKLDNLMQQCNELKITSYFDEILGISNIYAHSKVDMAKEWMNSNNINPEDCLFIGDSAHDFDVAMAMGVKCNLVCKGHQSKNQLLKVTNNVFNDISEVNLCIE